jgi:hypothetical protein
LIARLPKSAIVAVELTTSMSGAARYVVITTRLLP